MPLQVSILTLLLSPYPRAMKGAGLVRKGLTGGNSVTLTGNTLTPQRKLADRVVTRTIPDSSNRAKRCLSLIAKSSPNRFVSDAR